VQGDLEIRGVTKRVTIPVTVEQRQDEIVVQGSISLNRKDFGVNYNAFFNPVQDKVDVVFSIVGVKP
jgi:polyisoprenoid-binding protein YceI